MKSTSRDDLLSYANEDLLSGGDVRSSDHDSTAALPVASKPSVSNVRHTSCRSTPASPPTSPKVGSCAPLALKEVDDGDLLIVGDGSQLHYRRHPFTWREAGVNAVGRTINTRFDLDKNYRNTREIMKIAAEFVSTNGEQNDPEAGLQIVRPNPDTALRSGPAPEMLTASTAKAELQGAVKKILGWLEGGLKPSKIAVLYRANTEGWVKHLASLISQQAAVYWPHDKSGSFVDPSGACIRTMHSAKGLQWRAVLVMRCDMMPFLPASNVDRAEQERLERGLMYVAMTRAEEILAFTRSTSNGFASRIQQLLDNDVARPR